MLVSRQGISRYRVVARPQTTRLPHPKVCNTSLTARHQNHEGHHDAAEPLLSPPTSLRPLSANLHLPHKVPRHFLSSLVSVGASKSLSRPVRLSPPFAQRRLAPCCLQPFTLVPPSAARLPSQLPSPTRTFASLPRVTRYLSRIRRTALTATVPQFTKRRRPATFRLHQGITALLLQVISSSDGGLPLSS